MTGKITFAAAFIAFLGLAPLHAADVRTANIDINLIIDSSTALAGVQDDVVSWISTNITDALLVPGDTLTVWSAGSSVKTVYSQTVRDAGFKDELKKTLQDISASGNPGDFSAALRAAASRKGSGAFSYTVLISASTAALSRTLLGPDAALMRFSRIEEFSGWRAVVVGLNIDSKVRQAAAAWFAGG